eukprot:scaffold124734_cov63-Phaeocystis_antarctica.AAC.2
MLYLLWLYLAALVVQLRELARLQAGLPLRGAHPLLDLLRVLRPRDAVARRVVEREGRLAEGVPATICDGGCNPMWWGLQPYAKAAPLEEDEAAQVVVCVEDRGCATARLDATGVVGLRR